MDGNGQISSVARNILDKIDADISRAALREGGKKPQIEINRDRIAALLALREDWEQPDEVYACEAWEINIVWRSRYGMVEIGTEEDGSIGYYVKRTLIEKDREGTMLGLDKEELSRILSWLEASPQEI